MLFNEILDGNLLFITFDQLSRTQYGELLSEIFYEGAFLIWLSIAAFSRGIWICYNIKELLPGAQKLEFHCEVQMQRNLALNGLKWGPASLHLFPSWPLAWIWNPWDPLLRPLMKPLTSTGPLRDACSMISSPNIRRCQLEIAKFNANSILQTWSAKCNMGPIWLVSPSWHVKFA